MLNLTTPTSVPPRSTAEEMSFAILHLLENGAEAITEADLRRRGFTLREIAEHRDDALAAARRQFQANRAD